MLLLRPPAAASALAVAAAHLSGIAGTVSWLGVLGQLVIRLVPACYNHCRLFLQVVFYSLCDL